MEHISPLQSPFGWSLLAAVVKLPPEADAEANSHAPLIMLYNDLYVHITLVMFHSIRSQAKPCHAIQSHSIQFNSIQSVMKHHSPAIYIFCCSYKYYIREREFFHIFIFVCLKELFFFYFFLFMELVYIAK